MRRDKYEDERGSGGNGGSSWISYSDMMASLMLVFVLMLCVSLLKYFTAPKEEDIQQQKSITEQLQEIETREAELAEREAQLAKDQAELQKAQEQLAKDQETLQKAQEQLAKDQAALAQLAKDQAELRAAQEQLAKDQAALAQLEKEQAELQAAQEQLAKDQAELKAAQEQLAKDQAALAQLEKDRTELQKVQAQLKKDQAALEQEKKALAEERAALDAEKEQLKQDQSALAAAQEQLRLEQEALRAETEAEATAAPEIESEWEKEVQREIQRQQAILDQYSLRSRIIASQYSAFENSGLNILINQDTGDITTPNFILFGAGSSELSDAGKQFLDTFMPLYLEVLMRPEYESNISEVVIEGHTDSSFAADMELSRQRALQVMAYSLEMPALTDAQRAYLSARAAFIGRGFTDPVLDENGEINREASRRVEIKFQIRENHLLPETELVGDLISHLEAAGVSASVEPETGDVLPEGISFFEAGKDALTEEGKAFIRSFLPEYLDVLMKPKYQKQVEILIIEGAADRLVPEAERLDLSQRRTARIMEYCMQLELTEVQHAYLQKTLAMAGRLAGNSAAGTDEQVRFRFRLKNANSLTELRNLLQDN